MDVALKLNEFFNRISNDNRIGPVHVSLFTAIITQWTRNDFKNPVCSFSRELMALAKIFSVRTYHSGIKELDEYGYIKYEPSFNHFKGSQFMYCNS